MCECVTQIWAQNVAVLFSICMALIKLLKVFDTLSVKFDNDTISPLGL